MIDRLAVTWGKNATALRRYLKDHYTALPKGRVTRPDRYLILHGDDAPVADWLTVVIQQASGSNVSAIESCSMSMGVGSRTMSQAPACPGNLGPSTYVQRFYAEGMRRRTMQVQEDKDTMQRFKEDMIRRFWRLKAAPFSSG